MLEKWVIWVHHKLSYFASYKFKDRHSKCIFLHYSFQTVVQWSKFEIPHQLIHILNIDKTKIFTSIDHRRMTKDELSFSAPIWMEEQSLRISESSSGIVFYGTTWFSSYSSSSFQLLSVTYTQIHSGFIAGRVKGFPNVH